MQQTYITIDNGNRPFRVIVDLENKQLRAYYNTNIDSEEERLAYECTYIRIFIGESKVCKRTLLSGCIGEKYKGNTILVEEKSNVYTYIGSFIYSFLSIDNAPVVTYESPIGANEYPYPYAIDQKGNAYLFSEDVVVLSSYIPQGEDDLYPLYYELREMCGKNERLKIIRKGKRVPSIYLEVSYTPNPGMLYDHVVGEGTLMLCNTLTKKEKKFTREEYIAYNTKLGESVGCKNLNHIKVHAYRSYSGVKVLKD